MILYTLSNDYSYYGNAYKSITTALDSFENVKKSFGNMYKLESCELQHIGRYVYYIFVNYGYEYDHKNGGIRSFTEKSEIFESIDKAKESTMWKEALDKYNKNKRKFIVTDTVIASKEPNGSQFYFCKRSKGKFNMEIKRIRVFS